MSLSSAILTLCLGLAAAPSVEAFSATARPDRTEVRLGEVLVVTVCVMDAPALPTVRPEPVADCTITSLGPGRRTTPDLADGSRVGEAILKLANRISGQLDALPGGKERDKAQADAADSIKSLRRGNYVFYFRVQPEKAGSLTVPSFIVTAEGEKTGTMPFDIKVSPSGSAPWLHLEWSLSNPRPQVGEDVQLFLDVRMEQRATRLGDRRFEHVPLRNILLFTPVEKQLAGLQLRRTLEDVAKEHIPGPGHIGFRIKGQPEEVLFEQVPSPAGEKPSWFRYRLPVPVRFSRAGTAELPPLRAIGEVYVPMPQVFIGTKKQTSAPQGQWTPFSTTGQPQKFEIAEK
jgi:hypothetical protein